MLKPIFRKLLFLLLPVLSSFSPPAKNVKNTKPNIIFILSDDHTNKAIGIYGNKLAKTPHIDRIAKEGALFNNFL